MIGFSCPPLAVRPFAEAAELVIPHFEHWELICEADHWLPDIHGQVKELLDTTYMKISVHGPYSDVNLAAFDLGTRKHAIRTFLDIINISARLGIGPVTIHPGVIHPIQNWEPARVTKLTRDSLYTLTKEAWDNSVLIAFENMPSMKYTICQTASEMQAMLQGLNIGICFDIGHAHTTGQMMEMLRLKDRFINIHVHDNIGQKDEHLPLGAGTVDLSALKGLAGYKGNHIIEAKNTDMEEALASKKYLEGIMAD